MKNNNVEEIKKLIKKGFDINLISFELDIPLEKVKQLKDEMDKNQNSKTTRIYSAKEIIEKENKQAHLKMEKIRERYKKLYLKNNEYEVKLPKELSKTEVELINSVITDIEEEVNEIKDTSKQERREGAVIIVAKLKKIKDFQLTVDQAEKIYLLLQSKELENVSLNRKDKIDININKNKNSIIKNLTEAIDIAQYQTEDLEELQSLERKLKSTMLKENKMCVGAVKTRIDSKISKIKQKNAIDRIKNDVPESIENIIKDIAQGTLEDIKKADEIVNNEAIKRVKSKPQNRFSLTQEQEKRQLLIQIKTILMENSEKYNIKNPEKTIIQIQKLCGGDLKQSVRTVVKNLTNSKNYSKAKEICDKISCKEKNDSNYLFKNRLRNEIRNDEISDMVLKGIKMNGTEADERAYLEVIERGLKAGNVNLKSISLGKSQDGLRNITLADVWSDEKIEKLI